jgi:hypothetical protein
VTRGGRLPDPGLAAVCGRCGEPREAHGGPKLFGACPDQSGLRAKRFSIAPEDRPTNQDQGPELIVRQARIALPVSAEMLADAEGTRRAMDEWLAMTPEERAAAGAKRDAERAALRAAATARAERFLEWLRARLDEVERMATHSEHYCDCRDLGCEDDRVRDAASAGVGAHREIIAEHQPQPGWDGESFHGLVCGTCAQGEDNDGDPYPCVTLRALARAYGWSP